MSAPRPLTALLLASLIAGAAGCGASVRDADLPKVREVVTRFAEASDASACDLLTPKALSDVYGHFKDPLPKAHANCVRKSASFQGEPITITRVIAITKTNAQVNARGQDGKFSYKVIVLKQGGVWRIDSIGQTKNS